MEVWIVDLTIKFPKNYQFGASFVNDLQQTSVRASFLRQTKKIPDTLSDFTSVLFHFNPHTYYVNITFPLSHSRRHCGWCILIFTLLHFLSCHTQIIELLKTKIFSPMLAKIIDFIHSYMHTTTYMWTK